MPNPSDDELLHKVWQTAARLQCSERYVWGLAEEGELEMVHIGRAARIIVTSEDAYVERLRKRGAARRAAKVAAVKADECGANSE